MQAGNAGVAEASFRQTIEMQPEHTGALNVYGILLAQRGRLEEAEQYLERAVKAGGKSEVTFFNYALVLRAQKKPLEALEQFSRALALNESVAQTWNGRGATYIDLARYQDAVADFDRAVAIEPNFADAHFNKGRALAELRHSAAALASFDRAIALQPQFAPAWVGRGYALHGTGRGDEAFTAFERAMAMNPRLPGAWDGRGKIMLDRNLASDALSDFDKAIELQPDYAEAWISRGRALFELDRYQEALAAFERALSLKPLTLAYTNMAYALADLGRLDESMEAVRKAIEIDPGFTGSYFMLAEAKRFTPGDPDLAAMEALNAGSSTLAFEDRMLLDFALGKAYRDIKDYRRSIEHLLAGKFFKAVHN